jgi:cytochrome d ubiquinol oxidase subunit I
MKLAVIEAEWHTHEPPAAITAFGLPNESAQRTDYAVKIPWLLGLIATRSVDTPIEGIAELTADNERRIARGIPAYAALQKLRAGDRRSEVVAAFEQGRSDLGYALLLKKYTPNVVDATPEQILRAAADTVPRVWPMFWAFRLMVGLGVLFLFVFAAAFFFLAVRNLAAQRWLLRLALYCIPLPWVAAEAGWFVAEFGRQPWTISGILPTFLSVSNIPVSNVYASLSGFVVFYTVLLIVEMFLMIKYARLGPSALHTGRYDLERAGAQAPPL